jgi:effector-binding domain-containing protein
VSYHVVESVVEPRLVAGVSGQVARGRVGKEFRRYLDQVYAAGRTGAVELDGQNIFVYRACTNDMLDVDFCVGAKAKFDATGQVRPLFTPAGRAAMATHQGDYGGIGGAHAAITEWSRANGRALAGPSWEVYGHWSDDPAKLRTDVYYLLRD